MVGMEGILSPVKVARKKNLHTLAKFTELNQSNCIRWKACKHCYMLCRNMKTKLEARKNVMKVSTTVNCVRISRHYV